MRLNQVAAPGGGGDGVLASSAADKKRAATYIEGTLAPDTQAAGRLAEGGGAIHPPMVSAPPVGPPSMLSKPDSGLHGLSAWATEKGLSTAMSVWQGQVGRLVSRLGGELGALRGASTLFQGQDTSTGGQLNGVNAGQPFASGLNQL
ncbi:hypothetical protein SRB5_16560 [Streptomyces sp. RB5]|uniref:Uncharacterized protein n=1 Tax=Streptomyces smaragdinus TaxID=2585196 RepID=A0A7K0CDK0_9ACTN|nr:hypothetical protein [Streptomyces smaragdinus]MQY11537.1 hypothetical protein [Streptomyces smaragdinus]